jgi:lipopolysaccharide export LptBFGC system permease protein LptF
LLLALLYSLSRMSRSNEIISMLTAGVSVLRVLRPLFICGICASAMCLWLNYELAPRADAVKKADLERISKGDKRADSLSVVESLLAKDRLTRRVWFVRKVDIDKSGDQRLNDVNITQFDTNGVQTERWQAQVAMYVPRDQKWIFLRGRKIKYDAEGNIADIEDWSKETGSRGTRSVNTWRETPYRIVSTTLEAEQLTVPQLREYLTYNSDFPPPQLAPFHTYFQHRWALPISCLAVVFIAAPLGIVFSRRAVLASVAASLFIFFGYLFLMYFMLALGKGAHVPPEVAAWLPDGVLFAIGAYLLFLRSTNREFPKFTFGLK